VAFGVLFLTAAITARAAQPQKFVTFDSKATSAQVKAWNDRYVFVWGASNQALTGALATHVPKALLSAYYPYSRDPDAKHDVSFWKAHHPSWIAYTCDGVTPATMYGDPNVVLDITNPDVIAWQIQNFLNRRPDIKAVALDNFQFHNAGRVCGVQDPSGHFVTRYELKSSDAVFAQDTVRWLESVYATLHAHQVEVVINHIPDLSSDGDDPNLPLVARMVSATDGILDEHAQLALHDSRKAALLTKFVSYVESKGKWTYLLYQLDSADRSAVESAMANYLMMAGSRTAIYLSHRDDTYGHEPDFMGFDREIGEPCGPVETRDGVLLRGYSKGLSIFSPAGLKPMQVPVPAGYTSVDGDAVGSTVPLQGGQGRVLYTPRGDTTGCTMAPGHRR